MYATWALIGFFAATMTCLGMRILSDLPNKVRAFGVRQGVELSVTAAVLFALPPLVIAHFKYPRAALALAAVLVVLGISAFWVPQGPPTEVASPGVQPVDSLGGAMPTASWRALVVFFLFLAGNIGLWAFLERIGASLQVTPDEMGLVFAVLKLLGGVAAFSVAAVGERLAPGRSPWVVLVAVGAGGSSGGLLVLALASTLVPVLAAWVQKPVKTLSSNV